MSKKTYTADSLARALDHHGAAWHRPALADRWIIETGIGDRSLTDRDVYHYVAGLADMRRTLAPVLAAAADLIDLPDGAPHGGALLQALADAVTRADHRLERFAGERIGDRS